MTCSSGDAGCADARAAPPQNTTLNPNIDNDNFNEVYVNTDPSGNFDSSSADLTIPAGAHVLFAGLYWSGNLASAGQAPNAGLKGHVKLKSPGAASYTPVTATQLDATSPQQGGNFYQGFADVTAQVAATGSGSYTVANVQAGTSFGNAYAGWALVVAYGDDSQPQRNLTVPDGFVGVSANTSASVPVSGFLTPALGPVNTDLGFVSWEGDRGLVGDSASLADTTAGHSSTKQPLSDAANPVSNFFNSSISYHGTEVTTRTPNYSNTLGLDADILDASGLLGHSATSARIDLSTSGDVYAPGVVTFATQLYSPNLQQTKTVTDPRGDTTVQQGDTLTYDISGTNAGNDAATNVVVSDPIPANTTYVSGSATTPAPGTVSFDPIGNIVTADLGTIAPGATYDVQFKVTVNPNLPDQTKIDNTATTNFTRQTLGTPDSTSSSASSTVSSRTSRSPSPTLARSSPVRTSRTRLPSRTSGRRRRRARSRSTTPPAPGLLPHRSRATTVPSPATWARSPARARRRWLPVGGPPSPSLRMSIRPRPGRSATARRVAATRTRPTTAAPTAPRRLRTPTCRSARPSIHSTIVVGDTVTYSLAVTNHGPSQAPSVSVQDNIPGPLQFVGGDSECSAAGQEVTCTLVSLDAGASHTFHVQARAPPASAGTSNDNTATVSSATPDSQPNNNTASATVAVGATDLEVHKVLLTANPTARGPVRYRVTVTNNGPSAASGVTVIDTMTGAHDLSAAGCTATTPGQLSCPVGGLAAGQTVTIVVDATVDAGASMVSNTASAQGTEPHSNSATSSATVTARVATVAVLGVTQTRPPPPAATTPSPTAQLALQCTNNKLTLTDVLERGGRVLLDGAADASLVGHKVVIVFRRRPVTSSTVGSDGLFSTTAPLPSATIRDTNEARPVPRRGGSSPAGHLRR